MPLPLAIVAGAALIGGATIFSTVKSGQQMAQAQEQSAKQNEQMMQLVQQQQQQGQQNLPMLLSLLQQGNQQSAMLSQYTGFQMPPIYNQLPQLLANGDTSQLAQLQGGQPLPGQQNPAGCTCGGHGQVARPPQPRPPQTVSV
ncbi:MAG: hypothetical protein AMXMBFR33_68100 [Candidatus Xenobia bacterium]